MQFSTVLAIVTAMASSAAASPTAAKRSFAPGQCGIHIVQKTEANAEDYVTFTVKDANGDEIGDSEGVSFPSPPYSRNTLLTHIRVSLLPTPVISRATCPTLSTLLSPTSPTTST